VEAVVSSCICSVPGEPLKLPEANDRLFRIDNLGYLVVDDETNEDCEKTIDQLDPFGGQLVDSSFHGST
jgi:hypothetical protein